MWSLFHGPFYNNENKLKDGNSSILNKFFVSKIRAIELEHYVSGGGEKLGTAIRKKSIGKDQKRTQSICDPWCKSIYWLFSEKLCNTAEYFYEHLGEKK